MRQLTLGFVIAGLALTASPSRGAEGVHGEVGVGVAVSGRDESSPKFREYWYNMHSGLALSPEARVRYDVALGDVPFYTEAEINARSGLSHRATDGDASLEAGSYGLFKVHGSFERIGHQFAHDAQTLYHGIGTDRLTLDNDPLRFALQTSLASDRSPLLNAAEANASFVDIGLRRDIVKAGIDVEALEPVTVSIAFRGEQRRGARPFGAIWGSSPGAVPVVEVAEPIHYDTVDVSARVGYADKLPVLGGLPVTAAVTAASSSFTNLYESMTVENPFALTDSKTGGAAVGRYALAPSNSAEMLGASLAVVLPHHLTVSGFASGSFLNQDATLVPMTTNVSWLGYLPLPRDSADAHVVNTYYKGAVAWSPGGRLHYRGVLSQRQHDNRTEEFIPVVQALGDTATALGESEYVSLTTRQVEVEQVIDLGHRSHLVTAYENERESFTNGSSPLITQNMVKIAVDTHALDWASVRVSGEHAVRDSAYENNDAASTDLPWSRKYYAAARDRDKVVLVSTFTASEEWDVTVHHMQAVDTYPDSKFGLQRDERRASTLDLTYAPDETLTVNTYYTLEAYRLFQKSRQWTPGSAGDPYSKAPSEEDPGNWTADVTTVVNTVGMTTDFTIVPERLSARLEGAGSVNRGAVDFDSPVGALNGGAAGATAIADSNAFLPIDIPNVDSTRNLNAGLSLAYRITKAIVATVGYRYDVWQYKDNLLNDEAVSPVLTNFTGMYGNLLTLDNIPRSYEVHTAYAKVSATF